MSPFSQLQVHRERITFRAKHQSAASRICLITALCAPAFSLVLGLLGLKDGWDDGAITAAFSRTFADTGIIALTPLSPQVEGFSSLSWFFLLSLCHPFANTVSIYLIWMKVLSALFFFLSVLVFLALCRRFIRDRALSYFATWLMAFSITPFYEAFNGMEMNLALFLFLVLIYILTSSYDRRIQLISAWIVASLFLATRFEAPFALIALLTGCALGRTNKATCPDLPFLSTLFLSCCGSFVGIELWRRHTFGLWLPNTVYAKLWWPYQPQHHSWHGLINSRASATMEVVVVLFAPLLVTLVVFARNRLWTRNYPTIVIHPFVGSLALAAFLFGVIFGKNLGHRGRMTEYLIPFAVIFLVVILKNFSRSESELRATFIVVAALHFVLWGAIVSRLAHKGDGVPVAKFEKEGLAAEDIRRALHRDSLTILIPDVGGASLCCNNLRVLDIGLLTNPVLALEGYKHLDAYFASHRPEVVEVHEVWATASGVYDKGLLDSYSLVQVNDVRLFVRNDLYAQLLSLNSGRLRIVSELPACFGNSYEDREYSKRKQVCLDLLEQ